MEWSGQIVSPYQEYNFNWKEVNAPEEVEYKYQVYLEVEVQT